MSTIQQEITENLAPTNVAPQLTTTKSSETAPKSAVKRTAELIAAWSAGRFNVGDVDGAIAEFCSKDVVIDATSGAHVNVAEYKKTFGFDDAKDWFAFVGGFDYEDMSITHTAGPKPDEVWMFFESSNAINKATGKGASMSLMQVLTWEGDKLRKVVFAFHQPERTAAISSVEDVPVPPMLTLPLFAPHPDPIQPWTEKMALWGAGEFTKPETKLMEKHIAPGAVVDATDTALPEVLKVYEGREGVSTWCEHTEAVWEMSNIDIKPVTGLKPGCVMHRFVCDVKHKTTGKEVKGVQLFALCAYNTDGQFVYGRHYYVNSKALASIY